ncbi:MAG: PP2C family protein-serine/threonine phosphatase [Acidobacteriaceae bacterium]|nr:PP2C family protein-serine/threonine phosphatase [Acidobacteriaceae bacterium]
MSLASPSISAAQVLQAFHRDAPNLFLGAAFITTGLVALAFSALRRKRDPLFIYFGLLAVLYGLRLWVQASLLGLVVPSTAFYPRLRAAINYLVPVPFVLYLRSANFLRSRAAIVAAYVLAGVDSFLAVATFVFGPELLFLRINNILVIAALAVLIVQFIRNPPRHDKDFIVVRRGLLIFVGFALWDNVTGIYFLIPRVEAVGFAVFLSCLGYVAARRILERDRQLTEIQNELDVARRIQLSILPAEFPRSMHFQVAARYVPMTSVAGDFYDYVVAENGRAGLLIADVSGHGVPAALIASMVKLAAASQRTNASDPARFLRGMNAALYRNTQNQFVTAAYVYLDSRSRELHYSAAGHPPMLLLRNGVVIEVQENGLILAAFDFATYSTVTHRLEHGDRLLLYTDGIVEASDAAGEFLGREALGELLRKTAGSSPSEAADRILSSVQQWSATQDDDLTLIVCDFTESSALSPGRAR